MAGKIVGKPVFADLVSKCLTACCFKKRYGYYKTVQ
jgi:hypothetical protein